MPLTNGNVNLPTGTLSGRHQTQTIVTSGQLYKADAYRPMIVAYPQGAPVRLEEIGRVLRQRRKRQSRQLVH